MFLALRFALRWLFPFCFHFRGLGVRQTSMGFWTCRGRVPSPPRMGTANGTNWTRIARGDSVGDRIKLSKLQLGFCSHGYPLDLVIKHGHFPANEPLWIHLKGEKYPSHPIILFDWLVSLFRVATIPINAVDNPQNDQWTVVFLYGPCSMVQPAKIDFYRVNWWAKKEQSEATGLWYVRPSTWILTVDAYTLQGVDMCSFFHAAEMVVNETYTLT